MDLSRLWLLVESIPRGRVASYGDLGEALEPRASGRMVGRWMAQCPPDLPWWRVVNRLGEFPVGKRDPRLAMEQAARLADDGVALRDGRVPREAFWAP